MPKIKAGSTPSQTCYVFCEYCAHCQKLSCNIIIIIYYYFVIMVRVFENRVLRRIFGSKRDEVTGEWRKLHNEELSDLYCSPIIVWVIQSRRMR